MKPRVRCTLRRYRYLTVVFPDAYLHTTHSLNTATFPLLTHNHLVTRHTTHNYKRQLKEIRRAPNPPSTPITLVLPCIPKCIRHPANTPRGTNTSTDNRI